MSTFMHALTEFMIYMHIHCNYIYVNIINVLLIALNVKNKPNMSTHHQTQSSKSNCEYMFLSVITSSKYVNMGLIIF